MSKKNQRQERHKKQRWNFVVGYDADGKGKIEYVERSINKDKLVDFLDNVQSVYAAWRCCGFTYKGLRQFFPGQSAQSLKGFGPYGKMSLMYGTTEGVMPSHLRTVWNYPIEVIQLLPPHLDETNIVTIKASGGHFIRECFTGNTRQLGFVLNLRMKYSQKDDFNIDQNAKFHARQHAHGAMQVLSGLVTIEDAELEEFQDLLHVLRLRIEDIAKTLEMPVDELYQCNRFIEEVCFIGFSQHRWPEFERVFAINELDMPFWFEVASISHVDNDKPVLMFGVAL